MTPFHNQPESTATSGGEGGGDCIEPSRVCGNCRLWGPNFYRRLKRVPVNMTCAADAVMELPASFIPNRQTMGFMDGGGCCAWEATAQALGADPKAGA